MVAGAGRGGTGAKEEGVAVAQLTGGVVDGEQGVAVVHLTGGVVDGE